MSHYQKSHTLERDSLGRLVLIDASGNYHVGVYPVRAFPITAPGAGISIMDQACGLGCRDAQQRPAQLAGKGAGQSVAIQRAQLSAEG